jgi:hypothetical protein
MAKTRLINTRFWDDNYIAELTPVEKLLFLYFLTNPSTNICGVYEMSLRKVAVDTGIDREEVEQIVEKFSMDGKIRYIDGWVAVKNFIKHQNQRSPQVLKGIKAELDEIPGRILDQIEGIYSLSHLNLNPNLNSNPNLNLNEQALFDRIWVSYPKKVGKAEATRAFLKLKVDEELTARIVSAVALSKETSQWQDNEGRYIPHLATYLNQRRYEDELNLERAQVIKL